ncbi:MAG: four helix bundle protein [Cyanobacteria bacterium J06643_5]
MTRESFKNHKDLEVYKMSFESAMLIFDLSKKFPVEERYSLTDPSGISSGDASLTQSLMGETPKTALSHQIRRSSRSVCANLAEAWRKRRYEGAFIAKLSDSEAEAAETQTWIEFAVQCKYLDVEVGRDIYRKYNSILGMLVTMINNSEKWIVNAKKTK